MKKFIVKENDIELIAEEIAQNMPNNYIVYNIDTERMFAFSNYNLALEQGNIVIWDKDSVEKLQGLYHFSEVGRKDYFQDLITKRIYNMEIFSIK